MKQAICPACLPGAIHKDLRQNVFRFEPCCGTREWGPYEQRPLKQAGPAGTRCGSSSHETVSRRYVYADQIHWDK